MHEPVQKKRRIRGLGNFTGTLFSQVTNRTNRTPYRHDLFIHGDEGERFCIRIPEGTDPLFVDKIILSFRFHPQWREHFRYFDHAHERSFISGRSVDKALAVYVGRFIREGVGVIASCEGDAHPFGRMPYIHLSGSVPEDLIKVWSSLGWVDIEGRVSPPAIHGHADIYRELFFLVLDDWLHGDVDISASRYRVSRTALPLLPELPEPNEKQLAEEKKLLSALVTRINKKGPKADFDDLMQLRSGYDQYSRWSLAQLEEALKADPYLEKIQSRVRHEPDLKQALRWRLRGLDYDLVLRKSRASQILNERNKNKEKKDDSEK